LSIDHFNTKNKFLDLSEGKLMTLFNLGIEGKLFGAYEIYFIMKIFNNLSKVDLHSKYNISQQINQNNLSTLFKQLKIRNATNLSNSNKTSLMDETFICVKQQIIKFLLNYFNKNM
jgi:hypothetical protein